MFIVFRCRKCGRYLYSREGIKTRKCTCNYTNHLKKVKVVGRVEDEFQAAEIVRKMQGSGTDFRPLG
jgi:hypothetical protein